jgi:hypothetical protein
MSVGDGVEKERRSVPQRAPPTLPTGTVVSVARIIEWFLNCLYRRILAQSASFQTIVWRDEAKEINMCEHSSLHSHDDRRCLLMESAKTRTEGCRLLARLFQPEGRSIPRMASLS